MDADNTLVETTDTLHGAPLPKAAPIQSRFMFVDVAALRAKQLRRGARPRLDSVPPDPVTGHRPDPPRKAERIAMEEVRQGLVQYQLPEASRSPRG